MTEINQANIYPNINSVPKARTWATWKIVVFVITIFLVVLGIGIEAVYLYTTKHSKEESSAESASNNTKKTAASSSSSNKDISSSVNAAINPALRMKQSADAEAGSDVRATATDISACITVVLSKGGNPYQMETCASSQYLIAQGYIVKVPSGVSIVLNTKANQICVLDDNPDGSGNVRWQSLTGEVEVATRNPSLTCP